MLTLQIWSSLASRVKKSFDRIVGVIVRLRLHAARPFLRFVILILHVDDRQSVALRRLLLCL